MSSDDEVV